MVNSEDFGENTEDVTPMELFFSYLGKSICTQFFCDLGPSYQILLHHSSSLKTFELEKRTFNYL